MGQKKKERGLLNSGDLVTKQRRECPEKIKIKWRKQWEKKKRIAGRAQKINPNNVCLGGGGEFKVTGAKACEINPAKKIGLEKNWGSSKKTKSTE